MLQATRCPNPVIGRALFNPTTGEMRAIRCDSWRCGVCAPAKAHRLGLVAAAAEPQRFITLSKVGNCLQDCVSRLTVLSKSLRRAGHTWEYLAVPEPHQRAGWHLHLLQRGSYLPQRELSRRAASAGMGSVVWIEAIQEPEHVARYLVKYMAKTDPEHFPPGTRRYRSSRSFYPSGKVEAERLAFGASTDADPAHRWRVMKIGNPV